MPRRLARTYDQEYRHRVSRPVAATGLVSWPDWEPSSDIFRQVFFGKSRGTCSQCYADDHNLDQCPVLHGTEVASPPPRKGKQPFVKRLSFAKSTCRDYNAGKDCSWIKKNGSCKFDHLCSNCGEKHPASSCKGGAFDPG